MSCPVCDGGCSCHVNPPCSYCVEHRECIGCHEMRCDVDDETELCGDCYEAALKEGKVC